MHKKWVVHVDGSSTLHAGGIGVVLQSPEGDKLKHNVRLQYQTTKNEVEYEALLKGLELAKSVEGNDRPSAQEGNEKLEAAGRLIQWAIELSEFDIRFQPRNAIKA